LLGLIFVGGEEGGRRAEMVVELWLNWGRV